MPLERPDFPPEVWARATKHLDHSQGPIVRLLLRRGGDPELAWPHRVFVIAHVDEGKPITRMAEKAGWRFIEVSRGEPSAIEVREHNRELLVEIEHGPVVTDSVRVLEDARHQLVASSATYVPRLLRAPALHVSAIWLHADDEAADLLIPLVTCGGGPSRGSTGSYGASPC